MSRIKKILISATISLMLIIICTIVLNISTNKNTLKVPIVVEKINEGEQLINKITYVEVNLNNINEDVFLDIASKNEIEKSVANKGLEKGEVIVKSNIILTEEYLEKTKDLEFVSLPIKSATEGVAYRLKKGDKINVYYTAKRKLVDGILKAKIKVYSSNIEETMVTCLLYQNVEVIAIIDNTGREVDDGTATNILVRLKNDQILELANLKDQGTFTYSII